jgi:hypothetical protein
MPSEVGRPTVRRLTIAGLDAGPTYWRVLRLDSTGVSGTGEFEYHFGPPTLGAPTTGSTVQWPVIFTWSSLAGAASWDVGIANGTLGPPGDPGGNGATFETAASPGTALRPGSISWRVRPVTADWHRGDWATGSFTLASHAVGVSSPADSADLRPGDIRFIWTDAGNPDDWFTVDVATSPTFATLIDSVVTTRHDWVPTIDYPVGVLYWRVRAVDDFGTTGVSSTRSINIVPSPDATPPTGSVSIDSGASATASTSVMLSVSASDATSPVSYVALSNDGSTWTTRPYAASQSWTLSTGDGSKTVYAKWRDAAGNWSAVKSDTIVLDTTAPAGSITIAAGAASTASAAVSVSVPATDTGSGVTQIALSNDGATWTTRSYAASQSWTLSVGNGTRTVYAKWRDGAGNWSAVKSDTITLDTAAPTGSLTIASGARYATSTSVSLAVPASAVSGVSQVALSNDGATWTTRSYGATQAWTLPATNGTRTVYAKWRSGAGLWSGIASDTIVLDTVAPTATGPTNGFVAGSSQSGSSMSVALGWAGADATSGIARYELGQSIDGGAYATVSTSLTSANLTRALAAGHTYRFRVRAIDRAGNIGAWAYGSSFHLSAYQESSSRIHWSGTWHTGSSASYWAGHDRYASAAGAKASLTFTGRGFAWVGSTGPNRGYAKVYVNGTLVKTINLHASTTHNRRVLFAKSWTTSASRTITIRVSGTAGHPRVDLDALVTAS